MPDNPDRPNSIAPPILPIISHPLRSFIKASASTFLLLAASASTASAAQVIYSGTLQNSTVRFSKAGNTASYYPTVIGAGTQIAVDPANEKLTFEKFEFQTDSFIVSDTASFTTGFGTTQDFAITIYFNASTIQLGEAGVAHDLTPGTAGDYGIEYQGVNGAYVTPTYSFNLTGTYSIVGVTGSVTGSFSVPVAGYSEMTMPETLHTSGFPNQLTLSGRPFESFLSLAGENPPDVNLFSQTLEGREISWGLGYISLFGNHSTLAPGALVIPEPSALLLGCLGALGLVRRRR